MNHLCSVIKRATEGIGPEYHPSLRKGAPPLGPFTPIISVDLPKLPRIGERLTLEVPGKPEVAVVSGVVVDIHHVVMVGEGVMVTNITLE